MASTYSPQVREQSNLFQSGADHHSLDYSPYPKLGPNDVVPPYQSHAPPAAMPTESNPYVSSSPSRHPSSKSHSRFRPLSANMTASDGQIRRTDPAYKPPCKPILAGSPSLFALSGRHHSTLSLQQFLEQKLTLPEEVKAQSPESLEILSSDVEDNASMGKSSSSGRKLVMNNQEAVNLISHIEDAQKAAESLTREAMTRRSRRNISCLVIRFD